MDCWSDCMGQEITHKVPCGLEVGWDDKRILVGVCFDCGELVMVSA